MVVSTFSISWNVFSSGCISLNVIDWPSASHFTTAKLLGSWHASNNASTSCTFLIGVPVAVIVPRCDHNVSKLGTTPNAYRESVYIVTFSPSDNLQASANAYNSTPGLTQRLAVGQALLHPCHHTQCTSLLSSLLWSCSLSHLYTILVPIPILSLANRAKALE
jgi:hypothetical protein